MKVWMTGEWKKKALLHTKDRKHRQQMEMANVDLAG